LGSTSEERVEFVVSLKDINDLPPDWGLSTHTRQADRHCLQIVNSRPSPVSTINTLQQVWGYFMQDVRPPEVLLQISDSDNPFAPVFIALIE